MAIIIPRPNPWSGLSSTVSDWQRIRAEEEAIERAKKEKNKKAAIVAAAAVGTVLTAGALAPAIPAIAGTAAAGVTATTGVGAGISSVLAPATAGLFGAGGSIGLGGALALGSVGAALGGQLYEGDYAGALGSAAGLVGGVEQAGRDQANYGGTISREERTALAQQAAKFGTTLSALERNGPVIPQLKALTLESGNAADYDQLAQRLGLDVTGGEIAAQSPGTRRQFIEEGISRQTKRVENIAHANALGQIRAKIGEQIEQDGRFVMEVDDGQVADIYGQIQQLDQEVSDNFRGMSGSQVGAPNSSSSAFDNIQLPPEITSRYADLNQKLSVAQQGKPVLKPPMYPVTREDGSVFEIPMRGRVTDPVTGISYSHTVNPQTREEKIISNNPPDDYTSIGAKLSRMPPGPDQDAARDQSKKNQGYSPEEFDGLYLKDGKNWLPKEVKQTPEEKFNQDLISDAIKKSDDPAMVMGFVQAGRKAREIPKFYAMIDGLMSKIGTRTLSLADYQKATKQALGYFPALETDPEFANIRDRLTAIGNDATQNEAAMIQEIQAQQPAPIEPPPPPPPGSAASAEDIGRAAGEAVRNIPVGAIKLGVKGVVAGAKGVVVGAKGVAKGVDVAGRSTGGFIEGFTGIKRPPGGLEMASGRAFELRASQAGWRAEAFAKIQKQNIEAGIDEPVTIIDPNGKASQVLKGTLTPEQISELKQAGFTIPGL